ncbi:MAG: TIGR02757 family protein [Acidobacteriota bacterium]|nr:TIGR02757 family protein [Acidobacteriota bacterium]
MDNSIKEYLDEQAYLINVPAFIANDPVQFPRRYTRMQDIEIAAFTTAAIAWGNRKIILKSADRMLSKMGGSPYDFVMNGAYKTLGSANVHRTFFEHDLAWMLRGFQHIYKKHESLEAFLKTMPIKNGWDVVSALCSEMQKPNDGKLNCRCFPSRFEHSALKRVNLALRWLVRSDGIVDIGVWKFMRPDQLYIPLDLHVGNTARQLGLLNRKSNDRKAVEELTTLLREFCPEDPVKYDFALFGIGVNQRPTMLLG